MRRIDTPTSVAGLYVQGNASLGLKGTHLSALAFNAMQEELANAINGAGIPLDPTDNTQLFQALQAMLQPGVFYKNGLINGEFGIWQRWPQNVISSASTNPFGADRWRLQIPSGAGQLTFSRQNHPLDISAEDLPQNLQLPQHFARLACTTGFAAETPKLSQRIESVRTFAGLVVVVSFHARINSGASTITPKLIQNFGTGSSPSAPVTQTGAAITLTNAWNRYEYSFLLPNLAGKNLGVGTPPDDDYLELQFEFAQSSAFQIDISHVQLERGAIATEFETRRRGTELELALRYYETSVPPPFGPLVATNKGAIHSSWDGVDVQGARPLSTRFKVQKRAIPTVTWRDVTNAVANRFDWGGVLRTVASTEQASHDSTGWPKPTTFPAAGLSICVGQWEADAEL